MMPARLKRQQWTMECGMAISTIEALRTVPVYAYDAVLDESACHTKTSLWRKAQHS